MAMSLPVDRRTWRNSARRELALTGRNTPSAPAGRTVSDSSILHTRRMGPSSVRERTLAPQPTPPAVYWRRRFIALLVGLSALAVVLWALSTAVGGFKPASNASGARSNHNHHAPQGSSPPAAPSGSASPSANVTAAGNQGPHSRKSGALRRCRPAEVVLSVVSSQARYSARQAPQFDVDVVSTASRRCSFNVGSKYLRLTIMRGSVKTWTSAQCPAGPASQVIRLRRGVPAVVAFAWNGKPSSAGCQSSGPAAAAGSYTALASTGSDASRPASFRFR
jgi:hypothetical protein